MASHAHIALNAHLLSGTAGYRSAGIHGYLYNTLACLSAVDPTLCYTVFVGKGQLPPGMAHAAHRSRWPTTNPLARIAWEQIAAPATLGRLHPDLLHGMAFATPLLWGGPSVVTVYDLSFIRHPERLNASRRLYLRWITASSCRRARRVIAISESSKREMNALLSIALDRIDVAPPGVGPDFRPLPRRMVENFRQCEGLPERFMLFVGTLEPRKNLDMLLRAYAQLPQRGAVKLALVGDRGWLYEPILALIEELGLHDDTLMPGYISGESLPLWYNSSELFVYPSLYEGFGLPLLEAMACGTAVVAADATSLPEVVGPAGVLVPPSDVAAWVRALSRLLDDHVARADYGARGQERAASFTWERTAKQTVLTYRRALSGREFQA